MKEIKVCSVCGSTHRVCNTSIGLLCGKHYCQYQKYGEVKVRTKFDPNEIIDNGDGTSSIILYDKQSNPVGKALVDTVNVATIASMKWCLDKNGYVKSSKQEYLHRVITGEKTLYVDHINGDKLNNTLSNLRICSNADNLKNRVHLPSNNTSGILGVRFRSERKKWVAEIQANKVCHRLGMFNTKEEAIAARLAAELKYFGEYKSKVNESN